ncbi:Malate permease [Dissulfuribacter thermophilus]|uniref:Malate permease n=1 Tax=Dissulfuribacter thermophilus TaxID=1156395 RepID=A0A1B9F516_9BACT|nr:AEC family transporter [Dissulfuribacter thermophilus]OCC14841.1 Malate permease [Dissulfuribacter thermophilus]
MDTFIITISYLLLGIILRRIRGIPDNFSNCLNLFVIYVSLPALVLLKVPQMGFGNHLLFVIVLPWVMVAFSAVAVLFFAKIFRWQRTITGCLLLMVPLGNTSFLGIPMVRAFLGEAAIAYAMIYDQLGSFLALSTYGSFVLALFSKSDGVKPGIKDIVLKIATFPPFIALVFAFLARGVSYPGPVTELLSSLGGTLVPVVMIAVGYQLSLRLEPGTFQPLLTGLGVKLGLAPLAALMLVKALGLEGEAVKVAVFEAGMPPMVSAGALAIMAGLSPRLTAALVGLGIFLSFVTLPVLFQFL